MSHTHGEWLDRIRGCKRKEKSMRLIDADAFIAKLNHVPMVQEAIRKAMDTMPTIEERKTGEWLPDNTNPYEMRFICSNCKESQVVPTIGFTKYTPIWDWCPLCGCKMERTQP